MYQALFPVLKIYLKKYKNPCPGGTYIVMEEDRQF